MLFLRFSCAWFHYNVASMRTMFRTFGGVIIKWKNVLSPQMLARLSFMNSFGNLPINVAANTTTKYEGACLISLFNLNVLSAQTLARHVNSLGNLPINVAANTISKKGFLLLMLTSCHFICSCIKACRIGVQCHLDKQAQAPYLDMLKTELKNFRISQNPQDQFLLNALEVLFELHHCGG